MSAAQNLTGMTLRGERAGEAWTVQEQIQFAEGISAGHFSVGYKVVDTKGREAFLKATDLRMAALGDAGFLKKLKGKVDAHDFERTVLDHVRGANMDRVVIALDYGNESIVEKGVEFTVLFLVFEFANGGDLRVHIKKNSSLDLLSMLNVLHNLANAIQQLHVGKICHNDIKPGNFLVFDDVVQKLGDLGRATTPLFTAGHDHLVCAGDPYYAPPEQLYNADGEQLGISPFDARRVGDLFSLGSIAHFLLCERMITPELFQRLDPDHWPNIFQGPWTGTYQEVLPYIRLAWGGVLNDLRNDLVPGDLYSDIIEEIVSVVTRLGDPDPRQRILSYGVGQNTAFSVEFYISLFDRLRKTVVVRQRAG